MLGIDRDKHDTAIPILELVEAILKRKNFRGTDEAKGCGDEEEYKPSGIWIRFFPLYCGMDVGVDIDFCSTW